MHGSREWGIMLQDPVERRVVAAEEVAGEVRDARSAARRLPAVDLAGIDVLAAEKGALRAVPRGRVEVLGRSDGDVRGGDRAFVRVDGVVRRKGPARLGQ